MPALAASSPIRIRDRKSMTVYPSSTAKEQLDTKTYPKCPGAPRGAFTTHGVYVVPGAGPVYKLFVVGHGARESIEVFQVDTRGAAPAVTWTGCVIAPDPIGLTPCEPCRMAASSPPTSCRATSRCRP